MEKKMNKLERCETVAKYVKRVADLKNYGFSEEELAVDVKEEEGETMIKMQPRLFQTLKDFFDKEFVLPEFYVPMKNIIDFRKDGIIVVKEEIKHCYAPTMTCMLILQLFDKLEQEQKKTTQNKN